jgi:hypothetical protein
VNEEFAKLQSLTDDQLRGKTAEIKADHPAGAAKH